MRALWQVITNDGLLPIFKDTLLRCKIKPEVVYGNERAVQPRVRACAVKVLKERSVLVARVARDLDGHESVLRKWVREAAVGRHVEFHGTTASDLGQPTKQHLLLAVAFARAHQIAAIIAHSLARKYGGTDNGSHTS
jgi:transposase-like protein